MLKSKKKKRKKKKHPLRIGVQRYTITHPCFFILCVFFFLMWWGSPREEGKRIFMEKSEFCYNTIEMQISTSL